MANSKYEYVRAFERDECLLPNTWIVVRIDGRGFHKLSSFYEFSKPNDSNALHLMNAAAQVVMTTTQDIVLAYGVSDEFSFVFDRSTNLFERRRDKLVSTVVSAFTAAYVKLWTRFMCREERPLGSEGEQNAMKDKTETSAKRLEMSILPMFDGRAVCYPSWENLRDYLSWRQVDCHINNLYNTTFHALVMRGNLSPTAAEERLKGTVSSDKNEILFSTFGINYNNEPEMFRKGSVMYRDFLLEPVGSNTQQGEVLNQGAGDVDQISISKTQARKEQKARQRAKIVVRHVDIIKDEFWQQRPWIQSGKVGRVAAQLEDPTDVIATKGNDG